jgi:hypothetical protein
MKTEINVSQVSAVKDDESEHPIPTAWRPVIREIVSAFVKHDYQLTNGVSNVAPVPAETAERIANYIQSYGAELIELPEETWASSVCIWMGNRWEALIDLWSRSEGRSDLVLSLEVSEASDGFKFTIYMVYVL